MHLYGSPASPFVQRVLMTARAKGHELELRAPPGAGGTRSAEFRAISVMGRVPVLALDDGGHLAESEAIAAYLDEVLPGDPLLPGTALDRARAREIAAIALLEVGGGLRPIMVNEVFRMAQSADISAAARRQIAGGLDALDRLLDAEGPYATGPALTAADCALVPVLALMRGIDGITGIWSTATDRPRVAAYFARMLDQSLPRRSVEEMAAAFAGIMARLAGQG